jgi:hypothetical protein
MNAEERSGHVMREIATKIGAIKSDCEVAIWGAAGKVTRAVKFDPSTKNEATIFAIVMEVTRLVLVNRVQIVLNLGRRGDHHERSVQKRKRIHGAKIVYPVVAIIAIYVIITS